jgi:hypothetical protein
MFVICFELNKFLVEIGKGFVETGDAPTHPYK